VILFLSNITKIKPKGLFENLMGEIFPFLDSKLMKFNNSILILLLIQTVDLCIQEQSLYLLNVMPMQTTLGNTFCSNICFQSIMILLKSPFINFEDHGNFHFIIDQKSNLIFFRKF